MTVRSGEKSVLLAGVSKFVLWVAIVALAVASTRLLIIQARASFAFEYSTAANRIFVAPDLDPTVAEYAKARGDFWFERSVPPRPDLAALEYRRAIELNPREAFHWNDWGRVCARLEQPEKARRAFAVAEHLDPHNALIQRDFGNFLLAQGELDAATEHHARAIRLASHMAPGLYSVYWNLGRSPLSIAEALLGDDPVLLRRHFLDCLSWVDPAAAQQLWIGLGLHGDAADARCEKTYFDFLFSKEEHEEARGLWRQIARRRYNRDWRERDHAFWNGDFELPLAFQGGLEWQISSSMPPGVRAMVSLLRGGEHSKSLWIHFEGEENVAFSHVRHLFFVQPERTYRLRYRADALDLTTDSGPYVRVTLHSDPPTWITGRMINGTGSWDLHEEFAVPPGCWTGDVTICRDPIRKLHNKIKGDVWFDDFVLERVEALAKASSTSETLDR